MRDEDDETPVDRAAASLNVFVSYRRDDTGSEAARLSEALTAHFGAGRVFLDIDAIPLGVDFSAEIAKRVSACDVLLAVIGREWVTAVEDAGERRLDNPGDFVRLEIEAALSRGIPVVPVLVQKARMPTASELPDPLKKLAMRNGIELRHESWKPDVQSFMDRLGRAALSRAPMKTKASFTVDTGLVWIDRNDDDGWVVTYMRDGNPRKYTYTSVSAQCPDGADLDEMIAWVWSQPFATM